MIAWRVHIARPPDDVFALLATDEGRASFWAEEATERDGVIAFRFPNGLRTTARVLGSRAPARFSLEYFGSVVTFELAGDGADGTDLTLTDDRDDDPDTAAGWVSVLLALKAAASGLDLRNHNPRRTWDQRYVDN